MAAITKRVKIYAPITVYNITPPIHGSINDVIMTTGDILKCLCRRATVHEILPDGTLVKLNMRNYYTDNGAGLEAKPIEKPAVVEESTEKVADYNAIEEIETEEEAKETEASSEQPIAEVNNVIEGSEVAEEYIEPEVTNDEPTVEDTVVESAEEAVSSSEEVPENVVEPDVTNEEAAPAEEKVEDATAKVKETPKPTSTKKKSSSSSKKKNTSNTSNK